MIVDCRKAPAGATVDDAGRDRTVEGEQERGDPGYTDYDRPLRNAQYGALRVPKQHDGQPERGTAHPVLGEADKASQDQRLDERGVVLAPSTPATLRA